MFARFSTEFAKKSTQFFYGCNLSFHVQIFYRCFGRTRRCSYIRWRKSMIVWNQAEWLFDTTNLRYSANLVITSTISTYDTLFSLFLQFWKTKSVLTIAFSMLLHSGSLRHHSNRNWLKCLFSWSEFKYSIFVPETKLVFNPRFVRIVKILLIKVKMLAQAWISFADENSWRNQSCVLQAYQVRRQHWFGMTFARLVLLKQY